MNATGSEDNRGMYFDRKSWDGRQPPAWPAAKDVLPEPVFDERPSAVAAYWKGWELALSKMETPVSGSGLVSTHMHFTFNDAIFAHDSALMTMYGRFGHRLFPAIETLDNFYARQHGTGEICREISRTTGEDLWPNDEGHAMTVRLEGPWERHGGDWSRVRSYTWRPPAAAGAPSARVRVDGYTDHKFHWAEWLHYRITGDRQRLARVIVPLEKLYQAFTVYLKGENGLYITDWAGMDNSPRNEDLGYGVDLSSQMAFFALTLADMHRELGHTADEERFRESARQQAELVRRMLWNPETGIFHDLRFDGHLSGVKTVMGFAPLLGCHPDAEQIAGMVAQLENPETFNRPVRVPSLAADEPLYDPHGEYYLGGVWPYTNAMVIEGLERCGQHELAGAIARNYWHTAVTIYEATGTVWEYFAPEEAAPGRGRNPADPGKNARHDFAGWGAYPVIATFLEHGIGLRADAPAGVLTWNLASTGRCGCRRFAFGDITADLVVKARRHPDDEPEFETARSTRPFSLRIRWGRRREKTLRIGGEPLD